MDLSPKAQLCQYVMMVHFRNPFKCNGGSENIIISQMEQLKNNNIDSLLIFPIYKKIRKITFSAWGIIDSGKYIGAYTVDGIKKYISMRNKMSKCLGVFIHSFLFADFDELYNIINFRERICVYLHDYYSCCVNYTLMKNDESYCGDAILNDQKCIGCKYYSEAKRNKEKFNNFFERVRDLVLIAPSKSVAQNWGLAYPEYKNNIVIIKHDVLEGFYTDNLQECKQENPIKIAFVGKGIDIKGYHQFIYACKKLASNVKDYKFYHFGNNADSSVKEIVNIPVNMFKEGTSAMTEALRKYRIDVVVLFSRVPETYSLTYFESYASNCFIVGNSMGGNIPIEISENGNGVILEDTEDALYEYFNNADIVRRQLNEFREKKLYGPLVLKRNTEFLKLLNNEEYKEYFVTGKCRNIRTIATDILYRIRYGV